MFQHDLVNVSRAYNSDLSRLRETENYRQKLDEVQQLAVNNNADIVVITETWLHDDIKSEILELPDHTLYRLDRRDGRQGGGIAVYVKNGRPTVCTYLQCLTSLIPTWKFYGYSTGHILCPEKSHIC